MTIHDPSKIRKLARERLSSSLMSDTKWRKVFDAVACELGVRQMVVKFVDVHEERPMAFPPSLDCPNAYMDTIEFGPVELCSIEWVELPIEVEPLLEQRGLFPLERVGGRTRIVGYRA